MLPVVTLGELAKNATDGEPALLAAGVEICQQCGRLVRPIGETVAAAKGRKTSVTRLVEAEQYYLRDLLSRHALWQSHVTRENKMVPKDPPNPRPPATAATAKQMWRIHCYHQRSHPVL
jgi:hypothetical protein